MKKIMLLVAVASFAVACGNSNSTTENVEVAEVATAENGNALPVSSSEVKWTGKKLTGEHFGTVRVLNGELILDENNLAGGNFTLDMNSITVQDITDVEMNKKLTDHLFSEDFFNVAQHNSAKFEITSVEALPTADEMGNTHTISGNLTIKGITNGIKFPAKVTTDESGVNAMAKFDIDRTLWNIEYRSGKIFPEIGDKLIYDEIGFEVNLSANRS